MATKLFGTSKTKKGTELPLLNLKGKPYLQVAHRLVWFREVHPDGVITTTMVERSGEGKDAYALFKAEVYVRLSPETQPVLIATAHKRESKGGFADYIEKAETGSIGRALAMAGFGTQFTGDELDEGDRLADAPIAIPTTTDETTTDEEKPVPFETRRRRTAKKKTTKKTTTKKTTDTDDL